MRPPDTHATRERDAASSTPVGGWCHAGCVTGRWVSLLAVGALLGAVLSLPGAVVTALTVSDAREFLAFFPLVLLTFVGLGVLLVAGLGLRRPRPRLPRHRG